MHRRKRSERRPESIMNNAGYAFAMRPAASLTAATMFW
jgi:hypothetical protein